MPTRAQGARIQQLAAALATAYGPQHWWPAETRFEVLLGAILTQNTAWTNVEKALDQLRSVVALEPETILSLSREDLAQAIRPAGYFNQKAARIHGFCAWFVERGGFAALDQVETQTLRAELLALHGIGPETADDMVLYAFDRPVFVHHYPTQCKAFYMEPEPDRPEVCRSVDLLAPEGYGEIIGGGERMSRLDLLEEAIAHHDLPRDSYEWYLDLRRYGSVPHSGFGLGVERTVAWICGIKHIRETIPFPRTLQRMYP